MSESTFTDLSVIHDRKSSEITVPFLINARDVKISSSLAVIALMSIVSLFENPFVAGYIRPSEGRGTDSTGISILKSSFITFDVPNPAARA